MGLTFAILSQLVGDNTSFKRFVNDFHAKQEMRFLLCVNVSDVFYVYIAIALVKCECCLYYVTPLHV